MLGARSNRPFVVREEMGIIHARTLGQLSTGINELAMAHD